MTDSIPVHIYFLLDRSGSMESIRSDVIGGFNSFLAEQQATPGKCRLTLVQFDSHDSQEVIYDAVPIADVAPLTIGTFVPRGGTPLCDAEGLLMAASEARANKRAAASKKAEAVMFATFTDGQENSSREWTTDRLKAKRAELEAKGWTFLYLGVGHDGYGQAMGLGYGSASTISFAAADAGSVSSSYNSVNLAASNVRSAASTGRRISSDALLTDTK